MTNSAPIDAVGGVGGELGPLVDDAVEHLPGLGIRAGLVGRDQAVDDLLAVAELVLGVLGDLDDGVQERDPADVELGHVLLLAADWSLRVGVVVIGQGLEGRLHRLVALGRGPAGVEDRRADAAGRGHDRLLGVDGAGQLDELPGLAQLDHLGDLEERHLGRSGLAARRAGEDHRVLVEDQVLLEAGGRVGRDDVGEGAVEPVPDGLGRPAGEGLLHGLDGLGPLVRARGDLLDHGLGHAGGRQLLGRRHQRVEQDRVAARPGPGRRPSRPPRPRAASSRRSCPP